ncbi:hypothetical protein ACFXJ8_05460 [Nonomuraea sp. NPDC059194]|uniref:hypothetical protein n=1 Tax=Nonomuraea sp. NPDC059194 TaxID=3346764 RepID=UPI0036C608BC
MPTALRENAAAVFELLAIEPTPLGSRPHGEIPGAHPLAIANLVVLYTVEEKTVSIWRVRVDT